MLPKGTGGLVGPLGWRISLGLNEIRVFAEIESCEEPGKSLREWKGFAYRTRQQFTLLFSRSG